MVDVNRMRRHFGRKMADVENNRGDVSAVQAVAAEVPGWRQDLMALTKFRLSLLVVLTSLVGYWLGPESSGQFWLGVHMLIGTCLVAFAAAIFNQLMEIDQDARMRRTQGRPLPARRMNPAAAFALGWLIAVIGILHLAAMVRPENPQAAYLAAITLSLYVFVYTPMKRRWAANTLVGAVVGAIPPVIGWVAAGGGYDVGAAILFAVLFFWQLPHFIAINWMCREEYETAGFVMWSNGDRSGRKSAMLSFCFSLGLVATLAATALTGLVALWYIVLAAAATAYLLWLALDFWRQPSIPLARRLFFYTLLYLPVVLLPLPLAWDAEATATLQTFNSIPFTIPHLSTTLGTF